MIAAKRLIPAAAVGLLFAVAGAAGAQEVHPRTFGAGWVAGPSYVSDLNSNADDGVRSLDPGAGAVFGLHVDRWIGAEHRIGLRVQASYEQPRFDWAPGERKIDAAAADLSLLVRPLAQDEERPLNPYLTAGLGGTWYDMGEGSQTSFEAADAYHDGQSAILPTGVFGLGVDVPIDWDWHRLPVALRFEAADHLTFRSPLWRLADDRRHGAVHHVRFSIGMHATLRRW